MYDEHRDQLSIKDFSDSLTFLACFAILRSSYDESSMSLVDATTLDAAILSPLSLVLRTSYRTVTMGMTLQFKDHLEVERTIGFRRTSNLTYMDLGLEIVVATESMRSKIVASSLLWAH